MKTYDLAVIGAGPAGYVAAIRAAQLGQQVVCIEQAKALGGTCLRIGCIPSKALLDSSEHFEHAKKHFAARGIICSDVSLNLPKMMEHKQRVVTALTGGIDALFRKNKVDRVLGSATFVGPQMLRVDTADGVQEVSARHILIATGSVPSTLPGITLDGDRVVSSTEALSFQEVPSHLVVVGGGYIGLEMGTVWRRLGSRVTVLEYLDRILPGMDTEIAADARKIFEKQGLEFRLKCRVTGVSPAADSATVQIADSEPVICDRVLVSVGRRPATESLGLATAGVEVDQRGFIKVNAHFQTSAATVYAVGDVIGGAMLAHKAEEEGIACVEQMFSGYGHVNYGVIPAVVYTEPEIATVGLTEEQVQATGKPYRKGIFPFIANGRARAMSQTDGKVKVLADQETDRVLGIHIIGPRAGDLIAEAAAAMEFGATAEDIARTCHAHPTLAEAVKEAALAVDGRAIHF